MLPGGVMLLPVEETVRGLAESISLRLLRECRRLEGSIYSIVILDHATWASILSMNPVFTGISLRKEGT